MSTESDLARALRMRVRARGGMVITLMATEAGVPDRMVLHSSQVYLVELKADGGSLRPAQVNWHRKAAQRGINVVVLKGAEEIKSWTEKLVSP